MNWKIVKQVHGAAEREREADKGWVERSNPRTEKTGDINWKNSESRTRFGIESKIWSMLRNIKKKERIYIETGKLGGTEEEESIQPKRQGVLH